MNSIRRLLGEGEDCFAPVLASSSAPLMDRQRKARQLFREPDKIEAITRESVASKLKAIGENMRSIAELEKFSNLVLKLAESVSVNSLVPFDAEITASTTKTTNVISAPKPPEKDKVLAAILGKEPPVEVRPPIEQAQRENNQKFGGVGSDQSQPTAKTPTPQDVQRAMEDAMTGQESKPKVELVESSSMTSAMNLLQMDSLQGGGPLLGSPPTGSTGQVWGAFKKFVTKK